jgi:hypothetical protein
LTAAEQEEELTGWFCCCRLSKKTGAWSPTAGEDLWTQERLELLDAVVDTISV